MKRTPLRTYLRCAGARVQVREVVCTADEAGIGRAAVVRRERGVFIRRALSSLSTVSVGHLP